MKLLASLHAILDSVFGGARVDGEMEEELRSHLQNRADDLERQGLPRAEAERQARIEFGGYQRYQEECHDALRTRLLGELIGDVRYGLRQLRRSLGFTAVAVITLALGIGANTAIFSVVYGVLLRPLPFPNPQQLVSIRWKSGPSESNVLSFANFLDCQKGNRTFASMAAYHWQNYKLTGLGTPEILYGQMITAGFFAALGVRPILGRDFRPEDDTFGAPPVALISEALWKTKFNSSPTVLGTRVNLNQKVYTVVGVVSTRLPIASFDSFSLDVFTTVGQWNNPTFRDRKVVMGTTALGRLKPGVTLAQAQADMDLVARNLAAYYPEADKDAGIRLVPLNRDLVGDIQGILSDLMGGVGFVLLIACANVINLLLARSNSRRREFAIRTALGASRTRVIRQLLTESMLLAFAGGALGLTIANWGTRAIIALLPYMPRSSGVRVDAHVLMFTLVISVLAGVVFGFAPAVRTAHCGIATKLKNSSHSISGARHRTQSVFVVVEISLSIVLLIGAGLMIRSIAALWNVRPGFNPHGILTFGVNFSDDRVTSPTTFRLAMHDLTAKVESVSGIEAASGYVGALPMAGDSEMSFWIGGRPKPTTQSEMGVAMWHAVQPGYLRAMEIPLRRGRFISAQDNENSPDVVVVDEDFAQRYFPNENPLGRWINTVEMNAHAQIVGVVGHVEQWGLGDAGPANRRAQFYFALPQLPNEILSLFAGGIGMVARTSGAPESWVPAIRATSAEFDPNQMVRVFEPMDQMVAESISPQRFTMILLEVFAGIALTLTTIGVYGLIAYSVSQRTHEIGIRMALGALRGDVLRLVMGQGLVLTLLGVGVGLIGALGLTRFLASLLFGVHPIDPSTFVAVSGLLTAVALLACYIPALRATKLDPTVALRHE